MRARDRAERFAAAGWTVETLTSSVQTYPHTATTGSMTVRYLRSLEVAHTPIIFGLVMAMMKVPKDSVIQVETALAYVPEITAMICKLRKMPFIARVPLDSVGHSKLRNMMLSLYQGTVLKWVYRSASLVIVLTTDDVALIAEKYNVDSAKVRIIPNATDFTPLPTARQEHGQPFRLLFIGRVTMQKNLPLLLESLRYFIDTYSVPIRLDLAGDGDDMPRVLRMIDELSLDSVVSIQGFVRGQQVEELYEGADAFIMTSTHESFPQVLLEAMAKGLPVIAGNIHGVRTIVGDGVTGLLADLDKGSFARAVHRLIAEPGLYAKLSQGSLESSRGYSWNSTIQAYADVYDELLNDKNRKR